jgi:hypothetical protein
VYSATTPPATGQVHEARLTTHSDQIEMHVGLHTSSFGVVQLHAVMRESHVGITVDSERGDLKGLVANEMRSSGSSPTSHEVRTEGIQVLEQSQTSLGSGAGGYGSRSRESPVAYLASPTIAGDEEPTTETSEVTASIHKGLVNVNA